MRGDSKRVTLLQRKRREKFSLLKRERSEGLNTNCMREIERQNDVTTDTDVEK